MIRFHEEDDGVWFNENIGVDERGNTKMQVADIDAISFGPAVLHNYPCPVLFGDENNPAEPAVLDMQRGVFRPSWKAQQQGWHLICLPPAGWRRSVVRFVLKTFCSRRT